MTTRMGDVFYLFMSEGISDQQHHGMKIFAVCSSVLVLLTTFSLSNAHSKIVFDLDESDVMLRNDNSSGYYIFYNDELKQVKEGELLDWMNDITSAELEEGATAANPLPSQESEIGRASCRERV